MLLLSHMDMARILFLLKLLHQWNHCVKHPIFWSEFPRLYSLIIQLLSPWPFFNSFKTLVHKITAFTLCIICPPDFIVVSMQLTFHGLFNNSFACDLNILASTISGHSSNLDESRYCFSPCLPPFNWVQLEKIKQIQGINNLLIAQDYKTHLNYC